MKDVYGNSKPVLIGVNEWWFNGRIIQKQEHPKLPTWISFEDWEVNMVVTHSSKSEATRYAIQNPCNTPNNKPHDYLK